MRQPFCFFESHGPAVWGSEKLDERLHGFGVLQTDAEDNGRRIPKDGRISLADLKVFVTLEDQRVV
ncbi:MAG: hypothetical protein F4X12_22005 [Acidobacteriia bacterium]|nr:hypothetical protein [Terriglobia bacterium]